MTEMTSKRMPGSFTAGIGLIAAAAVSVLAMAHHPVSAHWTGGIGDYVHGTMIVLLAILFCGFAWFAQNRDLRRPVILAGLVTYGISLAAHTGAAIINGFIVPALAARGADAVGHDIFVLCREANQALAAVGVFATGAAFLLWSVDFLEQPNLSSRLVGIAGILTAVLPATALAGGWLELNVQGALVIYAAYAVWAALVGIQLIRGRV